MADIAYNRGMDELRTWTTDTFKFMLLKNSVGGNPDLDFVSDLVPGTNEISVSGYSRQTAGTKTRTIDDTLNRITYDCADPNFGTLVAGETVTGMVLYREVTTDADSILIAFYDLADTATSGVAFPVTISTQGVAYVDQGS